MINIKDFGAAGDGTTMNTKAIQAAIGAAKEKGTGIRIPEGTFLTGTLDITGVSVHLDTGSVLLASGNMEDYPVQPFDHNEMGPMQALLVCYESRNITLGGSGIIDLNGDNFYDFTKPLVPESKVPYNEEQKRECTVTHEKRPNQCIFFHNTDNLTVEGITVLNAPCWTFSFNECRNVKVLNLTIDTSLNIPNDDGLHFCSCSGVIVSGCNIRSGDDCFAFSGITNWEKPCENIVISNCIIQSCSKAIVLGYIHSHVRNVLIENVIIRESNRGLCIMSNPETGLVENVRVRNMLIDTRVRAGNWWGNGEAVFFMAMDHTGNVPPSQKPRRRTDINIRDIHLSGITCTTENALGVIGVENNIEDIYMDDIHVLRKPSENIALKGENFDVSPSKTEYPVPHDCGLYLENVRHARLTDINMKNTDGEILRVVQMDAGSEIG